MHPKKKYSQNFLVNKHYVEKTVDALDIQSQDLILEIGPGRGALCGQIIDAAPAEYCAVEIDPDCAALLEKQFKDHIRIINRDFLEVDLSEIFGRVQNAVKVAGNIPYHITSPIIFRLLDNYRLFDCAVLLLQKEVAQRISAPPGNKIYGILSVMCQTYGRVSYLFDVKRSNFYPQPQVDSAVIKIDFYDHAEGIEDEKLFRKIVRGTFNYRRKMLRNTLSRIFDKTMVYSLQSIDLERRPETLSLQEFKILSNEINLNLEQGYE